MLRFWRKADLTDYNKCPHCRRYIVAEDFPGQCKCGALLRWPLKPFYNYSRRALTFYWDNVLEKWLETSEFKKDWDVDEHGF